MTRRTTVENCVILLVFIDSVIVFVAPKPWPLVSWVVTLAVILLVAHWQIALNRWMGLMYALTLIVINGVGEVTGYPGTALIVSSLVIGTFLLWLYRQSVVIRLGK